MRPSFLKWIFALTILIACGRALAASPSRGLIIYSDIPSTYAETLEFVTVTNTNTIIATAVLPSGKKQELPRGGIIAIINYPPLKPTESLPQEADAALRSIQALRPKYPQFAAKLDAAQIKWNNGLEVYRQSQRLSKATPAPSSKSLTLEVEGVRYEQVVITSFDGAMVGIAHSAGVAGIAAIKLKPEQIAALNATSPAVRIDPSKIVAATPAPIPRDIGHSASTHAIPATPDERSKKAEADSTLVALLDSHDEADSERLISRAFHYTSISALDSVPQAVCGPLLALAGILDGAFRVSESDRGFYVGAIHTDRVEWGSTTPVVLRARHVFTGVRKSQSGSPITCVLILAGNCIIEISPANDPRYPAARSSCWWWNDKSKDADVFLLK